MESTRRWHLLVVCAAAFLAYINSIDCDFVYDDQAAIKVNADVHGNTTLATVFKNGRTISLTKIALGMRRNARVFLSCRFLGKSNGRGKCKWRGNGGYFFQLLPRVQEKSHKSYRPLTILSFRLTFAVARLLTGEGLQHRFFHVENLAYHVAVSLVFYMSVFYHDAIYRFF